jgi:hypothetical protein
MATQSAPALSLWPSSALMAFVGRQFTRAEPYRGPERRAEPRRLMTMPVVVQAVDDELTPLGSPQAMVICDLCSNGARLVYEFPFEHCQIIICLSCPEEGTILAAEVQWFKPLGPFYQLGCQIVARLDRFPPWDA